MRVALLTALSWAELLQVSEPESSCWGDCRSRSRCCYGAHGASCFTETKEEKRCCAHRTLHFGHLSFPGLEGLPEEVSLQLRSLFRTRGSELTAGRATALTTMFMNRAQAELRNTSLATPGQLPDMGPAYQAVLVYFVVLHGLRRKLSASAISVLLQRETDLWFSFHRIYTAAWGRRDFCRCVEAGEFFARANTQFLELGVGRQHFLRAFMNGSSWEHRAISLQSCDKSDDGNIHPRAIQLMAASSQCVPGNLATLLVLLHSCILEEDISKTMMLSAGMFQLATFCDCIDEDFWGFTARDTVLHYARLVWNVGSGWSRTETLRPSLLKQMAWNRIQLNQIPSLDRGPSWNLQCGPHELGAATVGHVGRSDSSFRGHGPLCTELGRFWLQAEMLKDVQATSTARFQRVLAIFPITLAWEANPWHHLHWWLPALWYYKLVKKMSAENLDVALVFPRSDIDWAISTAKGRLVDASFQGNFEPEAWSLLQASWPILQDVKEKHWQRNWGLGREDFHAGVLGWLSVRPARPLQDFEGESYSNVILGLPSLRFFLQTPGLTCQKISAVRSWVQLQLSSLSSGISGAPTAAQQGPRPNMAQA